MIISNNIIPNEIPLILKDKINILVIVKKIMFVVKFMIICYHRDNYYIVLVFLVNIDHAY